MPVQAPDPPKIHGHVKSYREPDNVCHSCEPYWRDRGKEPRILIELEQRTDFGHRVFVCPWCDGDTALQQRNP